MLDVGAHYGSSLAPFVQAGWSVHAFEPDPDNRAELQAAFGDHPDVTIVPVAVSDESGEMQLFTSDISTGVSSLAPFTATHRPSIRVPVITLGDYLARAAITSVEFMKVDVEGFERNVLAGHDWSIRPEVVVLEFENAKTLPLGYSWEDLADQLRGRGYEILVSEWYPIERYGGAHQWRRMGRYPCELADSDGWGNLIAAANVDRLEVAARRAVVRYRLRHGLERLAMRGVPAAPRR